MNCLSDVHSNVCARAASALGQLGKQTDAIAPQLAAWIGQNQQSDYVDYGIDALWMIMTDQA